MAPVRCFASLIVYCLAISSLLATTQVKQNDGEVYGFRPKGNIRFQRALTGKGVIKLRELFGTAKHMYTDGASNVYVKSGSYNDAIADFYNLKPTNVKTLHENGKEEIYGKVGPKVVTVQKDGTRKTLTVTDRRRTTVFETRIDHLIFQTIVYTN